ncbi:MAG: hypothetical protein COX57_05600 [Alphaproteobacteria bacterium CG_4_10_14_0_2_um_filter_63_37]|nr:MAG: hypothetical protein AUJ55_12520 [Proteobacteria bacterium CG1_02_64_396]PJA25037.1 MAG: hypothetical protein COX57_05600 [Alphaproteobacteria bacterium CG_4_10_14_0_2_um_filter_63_37]
MNKAEEMRLLIEINKELDGLRAVVAGSKGTVTDVEVLNGIRKQAGRFSKVARDYDSALNPDRPRRGRRPKGE